MREHWHDLPAETRTAVAARTGPVLSATSAGSGLNSGLAATLHTPTGPVFVKGMRSNHPRAWTQRREAAINPHVTPLAPRLLWTLDDGEWNLLGFEHLDGRGADYRPGSRDLPLVLDAITRLSATTAPPDVELKQIEQRLADYLDDPTDTELLAGDTILHTDWTPDNVLITGRTAHLVDWAWPTRGAPWIDAACCLLWVIAAGHTPAAAQRWAAGVPAWSTATGHALDVFATAQERLWSSIADEAPDTAWKRTLATAAHRWAAHRQGGRK